MAHLRLAFLWVLALLLASCILIPMPTECDIARADDGWVLISEPPSSIPEQRPSQWRNVVLWFEDDNRSRVKACERPKREGYCFEVGTTFELQDGGWVQLEEIDAIICTG